MYYIDRYLYACLACTIFSYLASYFLISSFLFCLKKMKKHRSGKRPNRNVGNVDLDGCATACASEILREGNRLFPVCHRHFLYAAARSLSHILRVHFSAQLFRPHSTFNIPIFKKKRSNNYG